MSDRLRWVGFGLVAGAGAGILSLTSMMNSAFAFGAIDPLPGPVPEFTQVMGGSGLPIPFASYIAAADGYYINPSLPGTIPVGLTTPENLYPLFPPGSFPGAPAVPSFINQLTLDASVAQGVATLNSTIDPGLQNGVPQGVFGYSQSAIISTLEMQQLNGGVDAPSSLPLSFVLIGDPNAPDGGLLSRFPGLSLSALGLTFSGATPADSFDTNIFTIQYDGFADFPKYPINLLSDINAFLGIETLHGHYLDLTDSPADNVALIQGATLLPGSVGLGTPDSLTNYYMIDTTGTALNPTGLPLSNLIYDLPVVGKPLAALVNPALTYLVNLGYGDGSLGYSDTGANVPTEFGLFPNVSPLEFLETLGQKTVQGIQDFIGALPGTADALQGGLAGLNPMLTLPDLLSGAAATSPTDFITNAAGALSGAASTAYGALLPTADILNSLITVLPAYDLSLFTDSLQSIFTGAGIDGLVNAFGLPVAANVGVGTLAAGFEFAILEGTISNISAELGGLLP